MQSDKKNHEKEADLSLCLVHHTIFMVTHTYYKCRLYFYAYMNAPVLRARTRASYSVYFRISVLNATHTECIGGDNDMNAKRYITFCCCTFWH